MKLNIGRCARCIAQIIKVNAKGRTWKYCRVKKNFCRYISGRCKYPSDGIPYSEWRNINRDD